MKIIIKHTPEVFHFKGKRKMPLIIKMKSTMSEHERAEFIKAFAQMNVGPAMIMPLEKQRQTIEFVGKKPVCRRVTFVALIDEDKQEMAIGISICNPKDQFIKKLGVVNATKAANENPIAVIDLKEEQQTEGGELAVKTTVMQRANRILKENFIRSFVSTNFSQWLKIIKK